MARKRVKVYQIGPDGKTLWRTTYEVGVKEGVKKYEAKIPYMVSSYSGWIDFVFDKLVETAAKIPEKIEGADPAENYARRGAPFARLFKTLGREYRRTKIAKVLVPAPPAKVREVPPIV
jgi:hypothetical protein